MKKALALLVLVLLLILPSPGIFAAQVTIRYGNWPTYKEEEVEREIIAAFMKANPNIKVVFEPTPFTDYTSKMITQLSGGTAPDVFNVDNGELPHWAQYGALTKLDDLIGQDKYSLSDFYAKVLDAGKYDGVALGKGSLYGLPINAGCFVLYYNQELFDKYKVAYPDKTMTYEKLVETAKKFVKDTNGDGTIDQYGLLVHNLWWSGFVDMVMRGFGARLWSEDKKSCLAGTPEGIAAVQYIADLSNKHGVMPKFSQRSDEYTFEKGNFAMVLDQTYYNSLFKKDAKFKWSVAPIPTGPSGFNKSFVWGHTVGINAKSKYKKEAWQLIKYLASPQAQTLRLTKLDTIPSRRSILNQAKEFAVIGDQLERGYVYEQFPKEREGWNVFHTFYDRVVLAEEPAARVFGSTRVINSVNKALK